MTRLYKIMARVDWERAESEGRMPWTHVDEHDGFIHLSSATQVVETAQRHFTDEVYLVLLAVDPAALVDGTLRWEASRDDEDFPHVYGDVPLEAVVEVHALVGAEAGQFSFPALL